MVIYARPMDRSYELVDANGRHIKDIPAHELGPYSRLALSLGWTVLVDG